ncbi:hypothetical protein Adeg_1399 [Ammonifex degensii KC4]|uniref:Uncharacterized protein n=1 Tax=Ammonifex degensii (strain DSM 10501 / KC4) TaxID=429009 RepID=C9R872_AMMDK|nr:hypothetical protein [Ammonifex degensii]ACX52501.1 hypothetical protein Adeg_1399 [Ammonifex degensii KC4]
MGSNQKKKSSYARYVLFVSVGSFGATVSLAAMAEFLLRKGEALWLLIGFLFLVVAANVLFDIVGTAATAASPVPFNAMAARRVFGAREALELVKNADRVANFANDVVGDIMGTLSGALGIALVLQLATGLAGERISWLETLVTAIIASLTVAGKAIGKRLAVTRSEEVVLLAGKLMAGVKCVLGRKTGKGRGGGWACLRVSIRRKTSKP